MKPYEEKIDKTLHLLAVDFNSSIWKLLAKKTLDANEKERVIQLAHASLLHWQLCSKGKIVNTQRGYYMIAKAYIATGEKENALKYAQLCYDCTFANENQMQDFDIGYAYEIIARAAAMNGQKELFTENYAKAKAQINVIENEGDVKYFKADVEGGNWFEMLSV